MVQGRIGSRRRASNDDAGECNAKGEGVWIGVVTKVCPAILYQAGRETTHTRAGFQPVISTSS